jgi:transposase-like protein
MTRCPWGKKSRYTDSQILGILKQNETGTSVPDLCREHDMSDATFYKWRSKFGGNGCLTYETDERTRG